VTVTTTETPTPEQAVRAGRLDDALTLLQAQVRARPADARLRVFLFQLLCVRGEWNRAMTQLSVAGELDAGATLMVQTYREALQCEAYRAQVFAGLHTPLLLGEPEEWFAWLLQGLSLAAGGHAAEAAAMRRRALEAAPACPGTLNGEPFEWLADADTRLGPCLELIVSGRYYWVPLHRIRSLRLEPPADLRDFVWTPAQLVWANGGEAVALIPSRYPGTESSGDSACLLCRRTEWREESPESFVGVGQRVLVTDGGETGLLDVRTIEMTPAPGTGAAPPVSGAAPPAPGATQPGPAP
jgi:type VI secretion system protein ImpE